MKDWLEHTKKIIVYIDESGNFDFNEKGSKYLIFTAIVVKDNSKLFDEISSYFYKHLEITDIQKFHASEDNRHVQNRIFAIIQNNLFDLEIMSYVFEKQKAHDEHKNHLVFYELALVGFIKKIYSRFEISLVENLMIITDAMPFTKKRKIVEKNIKSQLSELMPNPMKYKIYHHDSRTHTGLQIADYCGLAIQRKFEKNEEHFYKILEPVMAIYTDLILPKQ